MVNKDLVKQKVLKVVRGKNRMLRYNKVLKSIMLFNDFAYSPIETLIKLRSRNAKSRIYKKYRTSKVYKKKRPMKDETLKHPCVL